MGGRRGDTSLTSGGLSVFVDVYGKRVIRRDLLKATAITLHQPYLDASADGTNALPVDMLGWRTPRGAYERLLAGHPVAFTA